MHESPANFTWGITAGSAVIILPTHTAPIFLWAPATPCTSIYSAFFLDSKDLPESVSKTGNIPKCINPPINSQIDSFNEQSYWWQFKDLLDLAKGDQFGSKFNITKPIIRAVFDPLEDEIIDNVNSYINNNTTKLDITGFQFYEVKEVEKRLNTLKKIISNLNGL
jgi:secernin